NSDSFLADSLADSGRNSGETQWACLRHAHALARSEPLSSVLVLEKGLEPLSLATLVPKTSAYTNSATPAMCAQKGSNLRPYP
ncbi:MAG: Recombinase, partial [Patescibacteria group bacterium]|nr:Recombinase [Patescibacteria group bacterium]